MVLIVCGASLCAPGILLESPKCGMTEDHGHHHGRGDYWTHSDKGPYTASQMPPLQACFVNSIQPVAFSVLDQWHAEGSIDPALLGLAAGSLVSALMLLQLQLQHCIQTMACSCCMVCWQSMGHNLVLLHACCSLRQCHSPLLRCGVLQLQILSASSHALPCVCSWLQMSAWPAFGMVCTATKGAQVRSL